MTALAQMTLNGDVLVPLGVAVMVLVAVVGAAIRITNGQTRMEASIMERFRVGDQKFERLDGEIKEILSTMVTKDAAKIAELELAVLNPRLNVPSALRLKEMASKHGHGEHATIG